MCIRDRLLVDGGGALLDAVAEIGSGERLFHLVEHRVRRAREGNAVMLVKMLVLNGHKCVLHVLGNLRERHPYLLLRGLQPGILHPFTGFPVLCVQDGRCLLYTSAQSFCMRYRS